MLDPQFLHVCMAGTADRIHMRAAQRRSQFFEQVHRKVDAFVFIVGQFLIPFGKFVADFDRPRDAVTIPCGIYAVKGIVWNRQSAPDLAVFPDLEFHSRIRLGIFQEVEKGGRHEQSVSPGRWWVKNESAPDSAWSRGALSLNNPPPKTAQSQLKLWAQRREWLRRACGGTEELLTGRRDLHHEA